MIIEAKGSKTPAGPDKGRKGFDFQDVEKLSRLPLYVALLFTGLVAYLKSALPSQGFAADPPNQGDRAPADAATSIPRSTSISEADVTEELDAMVTGSIGAPEPRNSLHYAMRWPSDFFLPEAPSLAFARPMLFDSPSVRGFFPAAFAVAAANANATVGAMPAGDGRWPDQSDDDPDGPTLDDDEDFAEDGDPAPGDDDEDEDDADEAPENRAPTTRGPIRLHDVFAGQVLLIGLADLLRQAADPDGDPLAVVNVSVSGGGTLVPTANGWAFSAGRAARGETRITYEISDGTASVSQTAWFEVVRQPQVLTEGADVYLGTPEDNAIDALGGDDNIDARQGDDLVVGGAGDDHLVGGEGHDSLFGDAGNDVLFGGDGHDSLSGGDGNDKLFGDAGNDLLSGDAGDDYAAGGAGDDVVLGGAGNDRVLGEAGDDRLFGNDGDDALSGGAGNDLAEGGAGNDGIDGGAGDDILADNAGNDRVAGGDGNDRVLSGDGCDTLDGGAGIDILDYSAAVESIRVDLIAGTAAGADIGTDAIANFETVHGGAADDTFVVDVNASVTLKGGGGDDLFIFTVTDAQPEISADLMHEILDFLVGDRIRVKDYEISEAAAQSEEDRFGAIYDPPQDPTAALPIRVRHDYYDAMHHTVIEADLNHDDVFEFTIKLHGYHLPTILDVGAT